MQIENFSVKVKYRSKSKLSTILKSDYRFRISNLLKRQLIQTNRRKIKITRFACMLVKA